MLLVGVAGAASASPAVHDNEHFKLVFNKQNQNGKFIGSGVINGTGSVQPLTRDTSLVTIPGQGTFVLAHHFTSQTNNFDPTTCTGTVLDTGTWQIRDGTQNFAGEQGHGTFTGRGTESGTPVSGGGCTGQSFSFVVRGGGTISGGTSNS
jgi:hypothetical protein